MDPEPTDNTLAVEDMNTMLPTADDFKRGCASWHRWNAESKLVDIRNE